MTDLKPEDSGYETLKARLSVRWERMDGAAARKINTILAERRDALTAIDSLLADRARMEKALEPFAEFAKNYLAGGLNEDLKSLELLPYIHRDGRRRWLTAADFHAARQALGASPDGK